MDQVTARQFEYINFDLSVANDRPGPVALLQVLDFLLSELNMNRL